MASERHPSILARMSGVPDRMPPKPYTCKGEGAIVDGSGRVIVSTYWNEVLADEIVKALNLAPRAIELLSDVFGTYPEVWEGEFADAIRELTLEWDARTKGASSDGE